MPVHLAVLAVEVGAGVRDDRLDLAGDHDADRGVLAVARRVDRQRFGAERDEERGRDRGREDGEQRSIDSALTARPVPAGPAGASSSHPYLTGPAALGGEPSFTEPLASADRGPAVIRRDVPTPTGSPASVAQDCSGQRGLCDVACPDL